MKSRTCQVVHQNLWRYIDRELSAKQVSEISSHLKACESCKELYETQAREASLYRLSFVDSPFGDQFAESFEGRLLAELDAREQHDAAPDVFTFNPPVHHRRVAVMVSVAAMALIVVVGLLWRANSPVVAPVALPEMAQGLVGSGDADEPSVGRFLYGLEAKVNGARGSALRPGDKYSFVNPAEKVEMELHDGSSLTFEPRDWRFEILRDSREGGFFGRLDVGSLHCYVEPRNENPFEIVTPNGSLRVIGTRFSLAVERGEGAAVWTKLDVYSGRVQFRENGEDDWIVFDSSSASLVFPEMGKPPSREPLSERAEALRVDDVPADLRNTLDNPVSGED